MGLQSWMIKSWPMVEWYLPAEVAEWPAFWHMHTRVRDNGQRTSRRMGDTVWMGVIDGKSVGAAWDWSELRPGVVTLTDPNAIVSNIRFVSGEKTYQEQLVAMVCLNRLTHHLPWQQTVCAILASMQDHAALPTVDRSHSGSATLAGHASATLQAAA